MRDESVAGNHGRLTRSDFATDPITLAKGLVGCRLIRTTDDGVDVGGLIVETEAYCGVEDKAAHSVGWRRTPRTEPMFGPPGTAYVFLTYGMHFLFNVVCGEVDEPVAVLIRAVDFAEPWGVGIEHARERRRSKSRSARRIHDRDLGSGPAKLCQALGIDKSLNAINLAIDPRLWVEPTDLADGRQTRVKLGNGPRIGIGSAEEWIDAPLRWWMVGSVSVSLGDGVRSGDRGGNRPKDAPESPGGPKSRGRATRPSR